MIIFGLSWNCSDEDVLSDGDCAGAKSVSYQGF